jgi:hypothetical protein
VCRLERQQIWRVRSNVAGSLIQLCRSFGTWYATRFFNPKFVRFGAGELATTLENKQIANNDREMVGEFWVLLSANSKARVPKLICDLRRGKARLLRAARALTLRESLRANCYLLRFQGSNAGVMLRKTKPSSWREVNPQELLATPRYFHEAIAGFAKFAICYWCHT